jgi:hypothetical protein
MVVLDIMMLRAAPEELVVSGRYLTLLLEFVAVLGGARRGAGTCAT